MEKSDQFSKEFREEFVDYVISLKQEFELL
jgi:hypothetical protein